MPAARPSQAAVRNVINAMKAAGMEPCAIRVAADGGFVVETLQDKPVSESQNAGQDEPRRFEVMR